MEQLYPAGPDTISDELMQASPGYHRRALTALSSLLLFIVLYLSLTAWFSWKAYSLITNAIASGENGLIGYGFGAAAAFLALFLIKALFFVKQSGEIKDREITEDDEPKLFEFLYRLADEAKAPRPHRVFLSPRVNAAVFYNLTLLNLIFPSKKNLEIGLPLVNVLTLGELKAVLAHEFGHFRQGSMAIGRWIYVAQQIATHIIQERGALDSFLSGLSRFDLRIAWVGWILKLIVWSLRAILDTVFSLVILAERALSREMEFHADRVSVSLTGSDALIHALHKLNAADDAWDRALEIAGSELNEGKAVDDIFLIQKLVTMNIKRILDDETYDMPPPIPDTEPEKHRVFKTETAQPPRMWSTHPANYARENNAKEIYVSAPLDDRSAWDLFSDPKSLRLDVTHELLNLDSSDSEFKKLDVDGIMSSINLRYKRQMFNRHYKGSYLNRSITREFDAPAAMYKHLDDNEDLTKALHNLYTEKFSDQLEKKRNIQEEIDTLEAIYEGRMSSPDGIIRHRGDVLKKSDLPGEIEELKTEYNQISEKINHHDKYIRGVYRAVAKKIGNGWEDNLVGLLKQLHYAEHSLADLNDARGHINNVWAVITADGHVSNKELKRFIESAKNVYQTFISIENHKHQLTICPRVAKALNITQWTDLLNEDLTEKLAEPDKDNINDWIGVMDSWFNYFNNALNLLSSYTLDALLTAEAYVQKCYLENIEAIAAPTSAKVPQSYSLLLPGTERELQKKLGWWDRFQTADGFIPGLARFTVAGIIFGSIFLFGIFAGQANITIYNGLATAVTVAHSPEKQIRVAPFSYAELKLPAHDNLAITTTSNVGELIDSVTVDASNSLSNYVYNIAGAAPLVEWTEIYGEAQQRAPRYLGAAKWSTTHADYLFVDPPDTVTTDGKGTTKDILSGFGDISPYEISNFLPEDTDLKTMVMTHARWDDAKSTNMIDWMTFASEYSEEFNTILQQRLQNNPKEILSLRMLQDLAESNNDDSICTEHRKQAKANSNDYDWKYLAVRCLKDDAKRKLSFYKYHQQQPEHPWFAFASGVLYSRSADWPAGAKAYATTYQQLPPMRSSIIDPYIRMIRATGTEQTSNFDQLLADSEYFRNMMKVENGQDLSDQYYETYHLLNQGDLSAATKKTRTLDETEQYRFLRYIAASDGASDDIVKEALAFSHEQGIDSNSYWSALALAQKHKQDTTALLGLLDAPPGSEWEKMLQFFNAIHTDIDQKQTEQILTGVSPDLRGHAYVMALVLHGEDAPASWRSQAKKLLFSAERPFFN